MKHRVTTIALALVLAGCAAESRHADTAAPAAAPAPRPAAKLYDELGGQPAVEKLVDALVAEIHGDARINKLFANTDIPYFKARLVEQLCQATGGPCTYTGLSMEDAHSGLKITDKEFAQFVEDLDKAMTKAGLDKTQQGKLLAILGPMKPQVVDK